MTGGAQALGVDAVDGGQMSSEVMEQDDGDLVSSGAAFLEADSKEHGLSEIV